MESYICLINLFDKDDRKYESIVKTMARNKEEAGENIRAYLTKNGVLDRYQVKIELENNIEIIENVFGENYKIPFSEAKNMKEYKFSLEDEEVLKRYRIMFDEISEEEDDYCGGVEVLEFGNIDIELNITKRGSEGKKNLLDFFICTKTDKGWKSYNFCDYTLKLEDLRNIKTLERTMYYELMKFAKKHNLYWSRLNQD